MQSDDIRRFKEKLTLLKADLKIWNKEVFGHLETSKSRILKDIVDLDNKDDDNMLEDMTRLERLNLMRQLRVIDNKLESLYRQKARVNWMKNSDSNSKYYHLIIRWRRLRNGIKGVEVGGIWTEEPQVVQMEEKKLFEDRLSATKDFGVRLGGVKFRAISSDDNVSLISDFTKEEVKEAVWQCDGSKSPGPDGFNFKFIQHNWEVIEDDIFKAVRLFQVTGRIPKGCNASFITLVPKVKDPLKIEQYRPIALVGVLYKIIAKLLACRIKKVLPSVIDESQSAFLKERGMLDSVLLANEVLEDLKRRGKRGVCLKVDYEKAYDSVRWDFLYDMLSALGFHDKWVNWIRGCLESASVSVLVNGSPTTEFKATRGLRQGDPLAPFLFIIVA